MSRIYWFTRIEHIMAIYAYHNEVLYLVHLPASAKMSGAYSNSDSWY